MCQIIFGLYALSELSAITKTLNYKQIFQIFNQKKKKNTKQNDYFCKNVVLYSYFK